MYLVIAYRWGNTNGGQYIVYAGPDGEKAVRLGAEEAMDRGGKYGCMVYEVSEDGIDLKAIAYTPSAWGEEKPFHNWRIDKFNHLGHVLSDYAQGSFWKTNEGDDRMTCIKVEPPEWVTDVVARAEKMYDQLNERQKEHDSGDQGSVATS